MKLDVGIDINVQNIACLCRIKAICYKQHLNKIWGSIHEKAKQC